MPLPHAPAPRIPHVIVYGVPGGWGGIVFRIIPGETEGCWMCFRHDLRSGRIKLPPEDADGEVQPRGCQDPTFTRTGFDMAALALAAVRHGIGVICRHEAGAYGSVADDIAVLSMVDGKGRPILPQWKGYKLERNKECAYCNRVATSVLGAYT